MLDIGNDAANVIDARDLVPCHVELPEEWGDYFSVKDEVSTKYDDARQFSRRDLRGKAVIEYKDQLHTVYTKDLSRTGMGLYHCSQMLPYDEFQVWLPNGRGYWLRCIHCKRIKDLCFHCGTVFIQPPE